jgi:hypothetical protein
MKKITLLVCSTLAIQALCLPSFGGPVSFTSPTVDGNSGTVNGRAAPKVIGPLHLSEGAVIMKNNRITVLSNANDSIEEAELSGQLLQTHADGAEQGRTIRGVAFFTGGYSLPALDNSLAQETIRTTDGIYYSGHISDITPNQLRINISGGAKVISTKEVAEIRSPRAFEFSIPVTASSHGSTGDVSVAAKEDLITFSPTYSAALSDLADEQHITKLHAQLTERHVKKRVFTAALFASLFVACFALPIAVALPSKRPSY